MSTTVKEERRGRQASILGLPLVALIAVGALAWFNDWLTSSQHGEVADLRLHYRTETSCCSSKV